MLTRNQVLNAFVQAISGTDSVPAQIDAPGRFVRLGDQSVTERKLDGTPVFKRQSVVITVYVIGDSDSIAKILDDEVDAVHALIEVANLGFYKEFDSIAAPDIDEESLTRAARADLTYTAHLY